MSDYGLHDLCVVFSVTLRTLNNSFLLARLWESIVKANNCSCFYRSSNHLAAQSAGKNVRRSCFQVIFWSRLFILFNISDWLNSSVLLSQKYFLVKTVWAQNQISKTPYMFMFVFRFLYLVTAHMFFPLSSLPLAQLCPLFWPWWTVWTVVGR